MAFDFEALVGHLHVVGGRAISAPPPGMLVEVSPKKAARGREADTFFILVLPSGEVVAPASFYEQMAHLGAERYFSNSGSVTAGLRTILNSLNEDLFKHNSNDSKRYEASILCAVLHDTDLYLARVGSGVALFRHKGELQPFPADFSNDEALFGPPLGVQPVPDIKMAHYQVEAGTRLLMADATLADIEMEPLGNATAELDINAVLNTLKTLVNRQGTVVTVEFVLPEVSVPVPVREGESTAALKMPAPSPSPAPAVPAVAVPDRSRRRRSSNPVEIPLRSSAGKAAAGLARGATVLDHTFEHFFPAPQEGQRGFWSSPASTAVAIMVPILVVVMVLILWLSGTGESEFELCFKEANSAATLARGVASSDVGGTLAAWNAVLAIVDRCNEIRSGDAALQTLTTEARGIIDRLLRVDRRQMNIVASFTNAGLTRVVLQGEDLYVLDNQNDLVYRVKLTSDGMNVVPGSQEPIPSMRRNAPVEEFRLGDILDILWATESRGLSQGNVLLALDANGVLVECSPRFMDALSCEAQRLPATETWVNPKAIALWQGRLYVLDPGANQLWRYEPGPGAFTNTPIEYFVGDNRPDIRNAVDFGIDDPGNVYLLMADGSIRKYISGEEESFAYASFPEGQQITRADAMFLNTNPIARVLYIVSQSRRTIYETTYAGTFVAAYRPQDETMFNTVADVVGDANQEIVYVVSGNAILAFNRVR